MTPQASALQNLDDATVLRILSYATEQLSQKLPETATPGIQNEEEARQAIGELLRQFGTDLPVIPPEEGDHAQQARALLDLIVQDPESRPTVQELLNHPPEDSQKSVELALASAVILGSLIAWLQTNIEIDVQRKDGKTEFHFRARKPGASKELIRTTVEKVAGLVPL